MRNDGPRITVLVLIRGPEGEVLHAPANCDDLRSLLADALALRAEEPVCEYEFSSEDEEIDWPELERPVRH